MRERINNMRERGRTAGILLQTGNNEVGQRNIEIRQNVNNNNNNNNNEPTN